MSRVGNRRSKTLRVCEALPSGCQRVVRGGKAAGLVEAHEDGSGDTAFARKWIVKTEKQKETEKLKHQDRIFLPVLYTNPPGVGVYMLK